MIVSKTLYFLLRLYKWYSELVLIIDTKITFLLAFNLIELNVARPSRAVLGQAQQSLVE